MDLYENLAREMYFSALYKGVLSGYLRDSFFIPFYTIRTIKTNINENIRAMIASISTIFPVVIFLIFVLLAFTLGPLNTGIFYENRIIVYIFWILNLIITSFFIVSMKVGNSKKGILILINLILVVFLIVGYPWLFYF